MKIRRPSLSAARRWLGVAGLLGATHVSAAEELRSLARAQFAFAAEQYPGLLQAIEDPAKLPYTAAAGQVRLVGPTHWTSGFFPGCLWLLYEQTGDETWRSAAENYTRRLESIQDFSGHHDVGFMLGCSYGEGWRITAQPAYRAVLLRGARSLATRFRPEVGLIRSWDGRGSYPVIIDNMMNLGLLWFAAVETSSPDLREIVLRHAGHTRANHFRPDGSTYHLVDYDAQDGTVRRRQTVQGAHDDSAWARGQAWAMAGFAALARYTGDPSWLAVARRTADFVLHHPRLPADGIPYWDFDAPDLATAPRDASAAAVMAVALLDLEAQLGRAEGARYRELAKRQLRTLCSDAYRARLGENGHFLLKHSVAHLPRGAEVDAPLNYADYYFLKALSLVLGSEWSAQGVP